MRYLRRGRSRVVWLTACADTSAPTVAEIAAGTDITAEIAALEGFDTRIDVDPRPTLSTPFVRTVATRTVTTAPTALVFFDDLTTGLSTERALLTAATDGFLVMAPYRSPQSGDRVEVWPVTARGFTESWSDLTTAAQVRCAFDVTAAPALDATVTP